MQITGRDIQRIRVIERRAIRTGAATMSNEEAKCWCLLHVDDNWYDLPFMLMARGYNRDYENFTEVGADGVYELDESGCYIQPPEWWSEYELWLRDSFCRCGHSISDHDMRFDTECWFDGGRCGCAGFEN